MQWLAIVPAKSLAHLGWGPHRIEGVLASIHCHHSQQFESYVETPNKADRFPESNTKETSISTNPLFLNRIYCICHENISSTLRDLTILLLFQPPKPSFDHVRAKPLRGLSLSVTNANLHRMLLDRTPQDPFSLSVPPPTDRGSKAPAPASSQWSHGEIYLTQRSVG